MKRRIILIIFSVMLVNSSWAQLSFNPKRAWRESASTASQRIEYLFKQLLKSPTARQIIKEAKKRARIQGDDLRDVIREGRGSLTDTSLIRSFSVSDPHDIEYTLKSIVYVNSSLNSFNALLDLIHELTHFSYRTPFNPYTENYSLEQFVINTIEPLGGEVHAFLTECKVELELFGLKGLRYKCQDLLQEDGSFSYGLAINRFYQIGDYYSKFSDVLEYHSFQTLLGRIDSGGVRFVSSAYGLPYPIAAYKEYKGIMQRVCANDTKRLQSYSEKGRSPASLKNHQRKCQQIDSL